MEEKNVRSRLWNLLLYSEDSSHAAALEFIRKNLNYVGILHDKDTDENGELKKPHYHIIIKFGQPRWRSAVAKELGIKENYMEKTGSFDGSARYLLHDGIDDKYQYSPDELEGALAPSVVKLLQRDDENVRVLKLIDLVKAAPPLNVYDLIKLACVNGLYSDLRRMGALSVSLMQWHNDEIRDFDEFFAGTVEKGTYPIAASDSNCPWGG